MLTEDIIALFRNDISRYLGLLEKCQNTVYLAPSDGLYRRRPGAHFHHTPEVFLQKGGACRFDCPGGTFRMEIGDICIIPSGVPHKETPIDTKTPYTMIVVMSAGDNCALNRGFADKQRKIHSHDFLLLDGIGHTFDILAGTNHVQTIHADYREKYTRNILHAFLLSILSGLTGTRPQAVADGSKLVAEAEKLMRVEIAKPEVNVSYIASRVGCTPDHLTRRFQTERGMSFSAFINRERVQLACDLLDNSTHNVSEVAWLCGFTSASYFIRIFRTRTGMTPLQWKNR